MKCVPGCAGPGGPGTHRPPLGGLRSIRVPSGRHFELVVIGPLDRLAESLPAVPQRGDGLGSIGEDRVMG
jgi:hypothetical protein